MTEPSDEAINAAIMAAANPVHDDGHTATYYGGLLTAAYAIDFPSRLAEAHAAGRREQLDEIVAWLRSDAGRTRRAALRDDLVPELALADAIVARFSEQEQPG
jgi:hypothetical protein